MIRGHSRQNARIEAVPHAEMPPGREREYGYRIACGRCGTTLIVTFRHPVQAEAVTARAREGGWISSNTGRHRCPSCAGTRDRKKEEEAIMAQEQKKAPPVKDFKELAAVVSPVDLSTLGQSAEPRQPSPAQRRAIFREIEGIYDEVNGRYINGGSDNGIATKLKLPRKWVETIREENFGPAGVDPRLAKFDAELTALQLSVQDVENRAMRVAADAENYGKAVAAARESLAALMRDR